MGMRYSLIVLTSLVMFSAFLSLEYRYTSFLGAEEIQRQWPYWFVPIIFSVSTFLGVLARSIYEVVTRPKPPETYNEIFKEAIGPQRILLALVVSPIVIGLFYQTIRGADDLAFTVVSSFQNGFFWRTVLRRR